MNTEFLIKKTDMSNQAKINLLLVGGKSEDFLKYQKIFCEYNSYLNVEIVHCPTAEEALNRIKKKESIEILMVENELPDMKGFSFCQEFQRLKYRIPIIMLLEDNSFEKPDGCYFEAFYNGVFDYIIKDSEQKYIKQLPLMVYKINKMNSKRNGQNNSSLEDQETEEKFIKIIMLCPNAILISTLEEGQFIAANDTALRELGYTWEEIIGKTSIELGMIASNDREKIKKVLKKKGFYENIEIKLYTRSGKEQICLITGHVINIGKKKCAIHSISNISVRKKMQDELLKSKNLESLGILASGIAHGFNNYLTSIIGNISIAKMSLHDTEKIYRALNRAEEISVKASDLTNKLLTFSDGGEPLIKENNVRQIINNTISTHFSKTWVKFSEKIDNDIWAVRGDDSQLYQFFYNIYLNAVHAIPKSKKNGEVVTELKNISLPNLNEYSLKKGDYVKVSIEDNGIGIPTKSMGKIFDPFFTTKNTLSQYSVGLGLTTCLSIIKKHQGTISIDSQEGQGTLVTILIPRYLDPNSS